MGKPAAGNTAAPERESTEGTETSKYLEEEKSKRDSQSSGERNGKSPNRFSDRGCGASVSELKC